MRLDPAGDRPIFQQIADGLRQQLAAGVFVPGDAVPSIRAQAVKLRINPNTIKRAYEELQREGVLEMRPGLGLFVTVRGDSSARAKTLQTVEDSLARGVRSGLSAGLGRDEIDGAYDAAWQAAGARGRSGTKETRR
jgi:GntR family transcriptional regulator